MSSGSTELANLMSGNMGEPKLEMSPRVESGVTDVRTATPSDVEAQTDVGGAASGDASCTTAQTVQNGGHVTAYQQRSAPYTRIQHPVDKSLFVSFVSSIFFLLVSLVLFCPGLVVYLVLLPAGYFIKKCMAVCCCCCCCCSQKRVCTSCSVKYMSQSDAFWLYDDPLNATVYQALFVLEKGLDIAAVKTLLNSRLVGAEDKNHRKLYPRFSERVTRLHSGYAWVKDAQFSIDNHVLCMPDDVVDDESLKEHVGRLAATPLSWEKPLWEVHVRSNYGQDQDTVLLLRIHPCLSDGITLVRLLFKSLVSDWGDSGSLVLKPRFGHVAFAFNCVRAVFSAPLVFLQKWLFVWKDDNLLHGPRLSGRKLVAWSEPYNMAKANRIKNVTRSTLNDVLLAVTSGVLRTYFQKHGVTHPFDVHSFIPVDFQADSACTPAMRNRYALVDVRLPTNTEGTIPRLWEVRHDVDVLKNSADSVVLYGCMRVLAYLMPENLYHKVWQRICSKATCFVSSLQGPDTEVTLSSCVVKSIVSWIPTRANVALSISFLTYADQLRMSVIADSAVITEPEILTNDFLAEMNMLMSLLANRRIPGELAHRSGTGNQEDSQGIMAGTSVEEIQSKIQTVQHQLQELKSHLDTETQEQYSMEEWQLTNKVMQLKEEFRELLTELRRKKLGDGSAVLSDDDDEEDGELRRSSYRHRSISGTSRCSISSITSTHRPLTTSQQHSFSSSRSSSMSYSYSTPSSPAPLPGETNVSVHTGSEIAEKRTNSDQSAIIQQSHDNNYSPQVERKC